MPTNMYMLLIVASCSSKVTFTGRAPLPFFTSWHGASRLVRLPILDNLSSAVTAGHPRWLTDTRSTLSSHTKQWAAENNWSTNLISGKDDSKFPKTNYPPTTQSTLLCDHWTAVTLRTHDWRRVKASQGAECGISPSLERILSMIVPR